MRQEPPAGARVAPGSTVTVWTDPPGPPLRRVPDLVGLVGHIAVDVGRDAGLIVIPDPERPPTPDDLSGVVTDQRPAPGTGLEWGSFVLVWLDDQPGGGGSAGDREPRRPWPPARERQLGSLPVFGRFCT